MKRGRRFFGGNRRGLSEVIVTLLLVMLAIVLVGVVFVVVNNLVKSSASKVTSQSQCLSSQAEIVSYSCAQDGSQCNVTVRRTSGTDKIGGVRLIFSGSGGNTNTSDSDGNIVTLATKGITVDNVGVTNITSVKVAIYFVSGSGTHDACSFTSEIIGSIQADGTTGTGGGSSGSSSTPTQSGGTSTCTPASNPTYTALCGTKECGQVTNGTGAGCPLVICGGNNGGCTSGYYCNTTTYTCIPNSGSCTPASSTFCSDNGYTCGSFPNGTSSSACSGLITCGSYGGGCPSGEVCASNNTCINQKTCVPLNYTQACTDKGYQCGSVSDGCGGLINCGTGSQTDGCNFPDFCNSTDQCEAPKLLNNGTIYSAWPDGSANFFDSNDLPKNQSADDALTAGSSSLNNSFVRFQGINNPNCTEIAYISYEPQIDRSYVKLYLSTGSYVNISAGDWYRIWDTYSGCLSDPFT